MISTFTSLAYYTMFSPMMGCLHTRWWDKGTIQWIVGTWCVAIRSTIVCWCEVGHLIRINNPKQVRHSLFGIHKGPIKSQINCQWKIENGDVHLATLHVEWSYVDNFGTFCDGINQFVPCTLIWCPKMLPHKQHVHPTS